MRNQCDVPASEGPFAKTVEINVESLKVPFV